MDRDTDIGINIHKHIQIYSKHGKILTVELRSTANHCSGLSSFVDV